MAMIAIVQADLIGAAWGLAHSDEEIGSGPLHQFALHFAGLTCIPLIRSAWIASACIPAMKKVVTAQCCRLRKNNLAPNHA